jgi:hypothetical protein
LLVLNCKDGDLKHSTFIGENIRWNQREELAGQLYEVQWDELDELLAIPYAKFKLNK